MGKVIVMPARKSVNENAEAEKASQTPAQVVELKCEEKVAPAEDTIDLSVW